MKKHLLGFLLALLTCMGLSAQNKFEKGYIVNNDGSKIEGYVKNLDWGQSPSQIEFKEENADISKLIEIDKIKEFEIYDKVKYVKAEVDLDVSSDEINSLSDDKNPIFVKKTTFLKAIVEGEFTLYKYSDENIIRFFYTKNGYPKPLIFKRYLISNTQVAKNNEFVSQLQSLSSCDNIKTSQIRNLEYRENDLKNIFINFNTCQNADYESFVKKLDKNPFHISVRPGFNFSSLDIANQKYGDLFGTDFGSQTNLRMGVEFEFILPINNNKWSIIAEPTYQYFKKVDKEVFTKNILGESVSNTASIKYSSIEVPIGVRYYSFLTEKSKLFFNASFIFDTPLGGSEATFKRYQFAAETVEIKTNPNFGFGIGYKFDNKFSFEFNLRTKRNLFKEDSQTAEYKTYSIIFGYTLF